MNLEKPVQSTRQTFADGFSKRRQSSSDQASPRNFAVRSGAVRFAPSGQEFGPAPGDATSAVGLEIGIAAGKFTSDESFQSKDANAGSWLGSDESLKRAVDIVLASLALILAAPLMLVVSVAIRVVMGGPIFYSQERVGLHGRRFRCFKFRTMATNGDDILREHLRADPAAAKEWERTRKLAHDPRVGALGRFLRKTSIDELPQLFNILRGEMSCVGPRPIQEAELSYYGSHQKTYLSAVPGLTGLWQCSGRSSLSYEQRVELDAFYVKHRSLMLDLSIILRTIPALLKFHQSA